MHRSPLRRRFAAAGLIVVSALLLIAVTPLFVDLRATDIRRSLLGVQALPADTVVVDQPLKLNLTPSITLTAGVVSLMRGTPDAGRVVVLTAPVLDVALADERPIAASGADPFDLSFYPLIDFISTLSLERVAMRNGTVRLRWKNGHSLALTGVDAELVVRNRQPVSSIGTFTYLNDTYSFDARIGGSVDRVADAEPAIAMRRPLQISLKSRYVSVHVDGQIDLADTLSLRGATEVRTPDASKLAAALGYIWAGQSSGPAVLITGPARWANGAISFGRSDVSLSDQTGVGALSLSERDGRPRVEATLAFPALDVAPLLQSQTFPDSTATVSPWRTISTVFPWMSRLDAELRLSVSRLQWNGAPVGHGAVTLTASSGHLHGDLAELDLGNHTGSLQFTMDHTLARGPVSLRGRFESKDIAPLAAQLFGTAPLRGRAASQFDISGHGATLGEVLDRASGRGTLEMRDGQMLLDLAGLQKLGTALTLSERRSERPAGWGSLAQISSLDTFETKFLLRNGVLALDTLSAVSKGLVANVTGRVGLAAADLDLIVRIAPAATRLGPARTLGLPARTPTSHEAFAVRGPWSAPLLSLAEIELMP